MAWTEQVLTLLSDARVNDTLWTGPRRRLSCSACCLDSALPVVWTLLCPLPGLCSARCLDSALPIVWTLLCLLPGLCSARCLDSVLPIVWTLLCPLSGLCSARCLDSAVPAVWTLLCPQELSVVPPFDLLLKSFGRCTALIDSLY